MEGIVRCELLPNRVSTKANNAKIHRGGWLATVQVRVEKRTPQSRNVIQPQLSCIQEKAAVPIFQRIVE